MLPCAVLPASSPNWSCISHEVQESLIAAENAAIVTGRRELDDWHSAIMAKVERDFLEEHLSFLNKWASLGIYWRDRIWRDADTATRAAFERQNELFRRTVVSDDELKGFTQTVAEKMVSGFAEVLDTRLTGTAQRYRLSVNELDQHILDALNTAPIDVGDISAKDAHRIHYRFELIKRRLKQAQPLIAAALHQMSGFTGIELIHGTTAKEGAAMATKHVAHKAAAKAAAAKLGTATVAKVGSALAGGPFVLVALGGVVAWEAWDHKTEKEKRKPELLNQIGGAFLTYEASLLEPTGPLGGIIRQMRSEIATALASRGG